MAPVDDAGGNMMLCGKCLMLVDFHKNPTLSSHSLITYKWQLVYQDTHKPWAYPNINLSNLHIPYHACFPREITT